MKKVVLFLFDLGMGGTEKVMINLANYLSKNNFEVQILTISSIKKSLQSSIEDGVEIKSLNASRILFSFFKLFSYTKRNNFDFFIANVWPLTIIATCCALFQKGLSKKIILVEHCNLEEEFASKNYLYQFLQRISIRLLYPISKKVIAVSKGVRNDLVLNKSLEANLVQVIENPVDCKYFPAKYEDESITNWLSFKNAKLISVGNFKPQKNYPYLIQILKILKRKGFLFKQLIVGDGQLMKEIEQQIKQNDLSNDVFLAGSIAQPLDLIESADLFILPSSFEGFGLVIVEALSVGTTVVSTDCKSGPAEILLDGKLGYLGEVNNAESFAELIIEAFSNKFNKDNLKLRSKDFTIEKIGPQYIELFNS